MCMPNESMSELLELCVSMPQRRERCSWLFHNNLLSPIQENSELQTDGVFIDTEVHVSDLLGTG